MKKTVLILTTLLISILGFSQTFTVDNITYNVTSAANSTVEATNYNTAGGTVVNIPNSVVDNSITYNITSIGNGAFGNCQLTNVTLPNGLITIRGSAFRNNQLTSVTIPANVTNIEFAAFRDNLSLTSVISLGTTPATIYPQGINDSFYNRSVIDLTIPSGTSAIYIDSLWTGFLTVTEAPVLVDSISVQGLAGVSTITTQAGTLQMIATVMPANADDPTYTWSVVNGTGSASIDANGLLTALTNGDVTVMATANDASGITGTDVITISNQDLSVSKPTAIHTVSIYPNPTKSELKINADENIETIFVTDITGKTVKTAVLLNDTIDVSHLTEGIYFVHIKIGNELVSKKFIKE